MNKPHIPAAVANCIGVRWLGTPRLVAPFDGWTGTPEFPGYRAGRIVTRLSYLPDLSQRLLYLDAIQLDAAGRTLDAMGGTCASLPLTTPNEARSRFVCVSAELLRHAGDDAGCFSAVGRALALLRELGVDRAPLMAAAKLLDAASSDESVIDSLADMLVLSLGEDEALRTLTDNLGRLARTHGALGAGEVWCATQPADLREQLAILVGAVGRHRARHVLRMETDFDLVPKVEMYSV
ncbi:MAG: hypothetical protein WA210_01775 [Burkholderiaceae bacterium]